MKKISHIFFYCTLIILLLWLIPWCYAFFADKPAKIPFMLYSEPLKDFIIIKQQNGKGTVRMDTKGNIYTQEQTDSLLPFFFVKQLMSDEKLPDSIGGVKVSPREIQMTNFTFRSSPSEINNHAVQLFPLFESMSGRVELEMPKDVFRMNKKGIEFIDMKSNTMDIAKSELFTKMLLKKGFTFPALYIAGNPTTKKEYDNGYLLIDSRHQLFHLKMMKGKPYVKELTLPQGVTPEVAFVTEWRSKKVLGLFTDKENHLFVIESNGNIYPCNIGTFNPRTDALSIIGNMLDWTVTVANAHEVVCTAVDANNFKKIKSEIITSPDKNFELLHFTSPYDKYVQPRFR